jgi:hypothetical protein
VAAVSRRWLSILQFLQVKTRQTSNHRIQSSPGHRPGQSSAGHSLRHGVLAHDGAALDVEGLHLDAVGALAEGGA